MIVNGIIDVKTPRWTLVILEHEIGKYYRSLYKSFSGIKLERPKNDEHVTIITPWDKLTEKPNISGTVELEIILQPDTNGEAIWYPVVSKDIDRIRTNLGLGKMEIPLHYCIGYK